MKKVLFLSCMLLATVCKTFAYSTVTVKDSISTNTTWTCDKQYLLQGYVYVTAGATLTIDPGVIIKGDKDTKGALIIERGAKIMAMGTVTQPIVFTSNQEAGSRTYGDWGGVILCGKAPTNWTAGQAQVEGGPRSFYGGTDPHDNSGVLHYVRIEFGGVAFSPNNEVNSLTLCGVGDATDIDYVQCSYNGDDAFEWFGGTVNAKHLVAFRTWDDDFDTDCGFQGKVQFGAVIRDNVADLSGSKAFESDSYLSGSYSGNPYDATKINKGIFSNITAIGPVVSPGATTTDPNFVAAVHLRRGSGMSVLNSVIAGWPCGLLIDESSASYGSTVANISSGINDLQFRNNIICGISNLTFNKDAVFVKDGARSLTPTTANSDTTSTGTDWSTIAGGTNLGPQSFLRNPAYGNRTYATEQSSVFLANPFNLTNPNLVPNSTSPICYRTWTSANGTVTKTFNPNMPISYDTTGDSVNFNVPVVPPNFASGKGSDAWFTSVNYVGAFAGRGLAADNWTKGWCEFNPNDAFYDTICYVAPPPPVDDAVKEVVSPLGETKVYPNPATGKATVKFEMNAGAKVQINMMDMTGKLVKEIFNGKEASGTHTVNFDVSDVANGLYMITINAANKQEVLKISIIK